MSGNSGYNKVYAATKSYISLKDYGAVGDGKTDNFNALSQAINDSMSSGKPLRIPAGTYFSSKMLSLNEPIRIIGDKKYTSAIVFRDDVAYGNKPEYWQRGIVTITGNGTRLENLTLQYESNSSTPYTRIMNEPGGEGVLLSIVDASNVTLNNCKFIVSGIKNPSVTCCWFKSETKDIKNATVYNCTFDHCSDSTVGGGLWISDHDDSNTCLNNIKVNNCTFNEYAHDETMSIWGYNISNVDISENTYNYLGTNTFAETLVAVGALKDAIKFSNVAFTQNTFNINNNVHTALQVGQIPCSSSITVDSNTFNAALPSNIDFSCIGLFDCGNAAITNNTISVSGGSNVSFLLFDREGNVSVKNANVSICNCDRFLLIRSRYSQNNEGAQLCIENSNFDIGSSSKSSRMPTVQFPLDSSLKLSNTTISTDKSSLHEIVFQALSNPKNNTGTGSIELDNIITDSDVFFEIKGYENRRITIKNSTIHGLQCFLGDSNAKINQFELDGNDINCFYLNSKPQNVSILKNYANTFSCR